MTETGFREMGWEIAVLEQQYNEHVTGWDFYVPRLATYARRWKCGRETPVDRRDAVDDELWSAIGDPTRRRMLDLLLIDGDGTATTLSEQLPVTRQAVAKHLGVLDRVGLVRARRPSREKRYRVDDAQLAGPSPSWRPSGRRGMPDCSGSSASPRRSSAANRTDNNRHEIKGEIEMVDILHRVGVKTPTPDKVYDALTTVEGLAGWWTDDTKGNGDVGGVLEFRFMPGGFDIEVLDLVPSERVEWQVIDGPEEWIGTTIDWDLRQEGDYTIVMFKHQGWKEPVEFMHHCSTKWGSYLMSLKSLVETGEGAPSPKDVQISDWH